MTDEIKKMILDIRDSGEVNMLDLAGVQRAAFERNYFSIVLYIKDHKREYWNFIMTGEE